MNIIPDIPQGATHKTNSLDHFISRNVWLLWLLIAVQQPDIRASNSSSAAFWKAFLKGFVDPLSASTQAANSTFAQWTNRTLQEGPFLAKTHLLRVSSPFAEVERPKKTERAATSKKGVVILVIYILTISISGLRQTLKFVCFLTPLLFTYKSIILPVLCFTCIKQRPRLRKKT